MDVPNELMVKYLERRKQDLEQCLNFLDDLNYEELEKVGHQLKGKGTTFGHPELSFIGHKIESLAKNHNRKKLKEALKEYSQWIKSFH